MADPRTVAASKNLDVEMVSSTPEQADARIRALVYAPDAVYRLKGYVGYQIDLEFEPGETFVGLGTGDLDSMAAKRLAFSLAKDSAHA